MTRDEFKKAVAVYQSEKERWCFRYNDMKDPPRYEAVRNDEPDPSVIGDQTIVPFWRLTGTVAKRRYDKRVEDAALDAAFATLKKETK